MIVIYSHSVKVVNGTLEISHEAVNVTDGWVSRGILWDEDQRLPVVFESLVVFPTQTWKQSLTWFLSTASDKQLDKLNTEAVKIILNYWNQEAI